MAKAYANLASGNVVESTCDDHVSMDADRWDSEDQLQCSPHSDEDVEDGMILLGKHEDCSNKKCKMLIFDAIFVNCKENLKQAYEVKEYVQKHVLCGNRQFRLEMCGNIKSSPLYQGLEMIGKYTKTVILLWTKTMENDALGQDISYVVRLYQALDGYEIVPILYGFGMNEKPKRHVVLDDNNYVRFEEQYFAQSIRSRLSKWLPKRLKHDKIRAICEQTKALDRSPETMRKEPFGHVNQPVGDGMPKRTVSRTRADDRLDIGRDLNTSGSSKQPAVGLPSHVTSDSSSNYHQRAQMSSMPASANGHKNTHESLGKQLGNGKINSSEKLERGGLNQVGKLDSIPPALVNETTSEGTLKEEDKEEPAHVNMSTMPTNAGSRTTANDEEELDGTRQQTASLHVFQADTEPGPSLFVIRGGHGTQLHPQPSIPLSSRTTTDIDDEIENIILMQDTLEKLPFVDGDFDNRSLVDLDVSN